MTTLRNFKTSPWDSTVFGVNAFEITDLSRETLEVTVRQPGHYTIRVDPLTSKQLLHEYGFYYCDTLIEPYCTANLFREYNKEAVSISRDVALEPILEICSGAFSHGRFHRDFNLLRTHADQRYNKWLSQLHETGNVYGLLYENVLIGFIATERNCLILHAIASSFRKQGLAKFLWTPVIRYMFEQGWYELVSSISASNMAVFNLYATLGFRFRNPLDLYHRLTK